MLTVPLQDRIILKRIDTPDKSTGGIYIPQVARKPAQECEVLAVGLGLELPDGRRLQSGVKVGDRVLIGEWTGGDCKVEGQDVIFVRGHEILAVVDP